MAVTTISSRDFYQRTNVATQAAKQGPVVVTVRGEPTHVLLTYADYKKLASDGLNILEMLSMPGGDDIDFDIPKLDIKLRDVDLS